MTLKPRSTHRDLHNNFVDIIHDWGWPGAGVGVDGWEPTREGRLLDLILSTLT